MMGEGEDGWGSSPLMDGQLDGAQTYDNTSDIGESFMDTLAGLVPWCESLSELQHPLYQVSQALCLVAFAAPSSRLGLLFMHSLLIAGFLVYSIWAWNIACARDVFTWGFAFTLLNLGQALYVLYQTRPVKTDKELESVYRQLFRPLNVGRSVFKKLVSSDCCQVTSLHAGEAYAMQDLTRTDRLGLLLSGQVHVLNGGQFLHSISPMEFLDSPEFESSRASLDEKFKVSIVSASTSRYLFWKRSSLETLFIKEHHLATVLSTLVASDITNKLYNMNKKMVTENGHHLDIRLPSLTSSLYPRLIGELPPMLEHHREPPLTRGESYARTTPEGINPQYSRPRTSSMGGNEGQHSSPPTSSNEGQYSRPRTSSMGGNEGQNSRPRTSSIGGKEGRYSRPSTTSVEGNEERLSRPSTSSIGGIEGRYSRPSTGSMRGVGGMQSRPQTGGGYGTPLGYSNSARELLRGAGDPDRPRSGMTTPRPNKTEHPLH
uniref:Popeye domain-containing protein 3-like n=2 Tax=Hirondellea gigas TaxID=1518452 RepID=A0A6A7G6C3_9CRUS